MINGSNIIQNGAINIEVTKQNKMPAFFGPFDPRKKIPAGDNANTKSPGGIEPTNNAAVLYRSTPTPKALFSFNTTQTYDLTAVNANPSLYTELYVLSTEMGYEVQGSDSYAKYYQRFYPISSVIRTVTISGIARNEYEYEDLAWWIRLAQSDLAKGTLDVMGLYVPASGINAFGFIPQMVVKLGAAGGDTPDPIPRGIAYQFDFTITQDATDPQQSIYGDVMTPDTSHTVASFRSQSWIQNSDFAQYTTGINTANRFAKVNVNYGNGIAT